MKTILKSIMSFLLILNVCNTVTGQGNEATKEEQKTIDADSAFMWNGLIVFQKADKDTFEISPLSVSFGYNFDFIDGIKANDLYADFNAQFPNVFKEVKKEESGFLNKLKYSFGLDAGAYQLRTVSILDTLNETFRMVDAASNQNDSLILSFVTTDSRSIKKTKRENLGIFIQPKFQLIGTSNKVKEESSRLNLLFHAEWLRSIVNQTIERNVSNTSISSSAPDDWPRPYNTVNAIPSSENNRKTVFNTYLGAGFDLKIKKPKGHYHLKTIFGYNNFKLVEELGFEEGTRLTFDEGAFYLIQMNVLETKLTGIKLGMEVRGVFTRSTPQVTLDRTVPIFSIYLAKQFGFNKIGEFLKGA